MSSIGQRLRQLRAHLGVTQNELSSRARISRTYISDVEAERRQPSKNFLMSLNESFSASPSWLLTGEGPMILETEEERNDRLAREILGTDLTATRQIMSKIPDELLADETVNQIVEIMLNLDEESRQEMLRFAKKEQLLAELMKERAG